MKRTRIGSTEYAKFEKGQQPLPFTVGEALAYETAKSPQADVREVNQSPVAKRLTRGTK